MSTTTEPQGPALDTELLAGLGLFSAASLGRYVAREHNGQDALVVRLLTRKSVNVAVGDSGLGKTPLMMQLGLCVAAGIEFLGMPCAQSRVLYLGFEDGAAQLLDTMHRLTKHLGLMNVPDNFTLWLRETGKPMPQSDVVTKLNIGLVIGDPVRLWVPSVEDHKTAAAAMQMLYRWAANGAAVLLVHHLKKSNKDNPMPHLEDESTRVNSWLESASGARALINHSATRIAIEAAHVSPSADLVIRWNKRGFGDIGPLLLRKATDPNDGEPLGWEPLIGVNLLPDATSRDRFRQLATDFSFGDVRTACGGSSNDVPTRLIGRFIDAGLAFKTGRGQYRKRTL